ncbi:MAG: hypothetical protein ABIW31_07460, partial [Novosphingobium sp.]
FSTMTPDQLQQTAMHLKDVVFNRFVTLGEAGKLSPQIGGTDITPTVSSLIGHGYTFKDAETVLAKAGFRVGPRPSSAIEHDPNRPKDWYSVLAVLELPIKYPPSRSIAYVTLNPPAPGDYTILASMSAAIRTSLP